MPEVRRFPSFDDVMADRFPDAEWGTCRWCGEGIFRPDGTRNARRRWHKPCQEALDLRINWGAMRMRAFSRDFGTCRACGFDAEGAALELTRQAVERRAARGATPFGRLLVDSGFDLSSSLWEADHVLALADGGAHDVDWLWVLCQLCHGRKTQLEAAVRSGRSSYPQPIQDARAAAPDPLRHMAAWAELLQVEAKAWRR